MSSSFRILCRSVPIFKFTNRHFYKVSEAEVRELRRRTVKSEAVCRKALQMAHGDICKAEKFVRGCVGEQERKLVENDISSGLVAIASDKNIVSLIKISSKSDSVIRTDPFLELLRATIRKSLTFYHDDQKAPKLESLDISDKSNLLEWTERSGLRDHFVKASNDVKEDLCLERMIICQIPNDIKVGAYAHWVEGNNKLMQDIPGVFGVSASFVLMRFLEDFDDAETGKIAKNVAIHITAMLSQTIDRKFHKIADTDALYDQKFIFNFDKTVGEYLKAYNAHVTQFYRDDFGQ